MLRKHQSIFLSKTGFSLMEGLMASLVFAIAVVGVFATLAAVKRPTVETDKSFAAAKCTQQILESLRAKVDQRNYDSGELSINAPGSPHTLSNAQLATFAACSQLTTISFSYDVVSAGASGARKVVAQITW